MRAILLALLLVGCASRPPAVKAAQDAEAQDRMVQDSGTKSEKCASRQRVRDAWLAANDQDNYRKWSALADIQCTT